MFRMSDVQLRQRRGSGLGPLGAFFPSSLLFSRLFMTLCRSCWAAELPVLPGRLGGVFWSRETPNQR